MASRCPQANKTPKQKSRWVVEQRWTRGRSGVEVEESLETETEQRARPKLKDQGTRAEPAEQRAKVEPTVQKMKQKTTKM